MDNHLAKYAAFVKAVEKGSFTKAAQDLNYAQSSVSKMIADLENEWGITLLERGKGGVCLTASGEKVLPLIREILNRQRGLDGYINKMKGIQTGLVRIGTFASTAINLLPDVFSEFQKDYPNIECEMLLGDYDEVERWIDEGRVDCGMVRLQNKADFDTVLLIEDEYKAVLPVGHPLAKGEVVRVEDLNGQPFLLLERGGKTEVTELLEKNRVRPNIRFTTWEDFAIMAMAEKGLGIGILPSLILKRIPYRVEIRPLEPPYYRKIGLAVKNKERLTPATEMFIKYLEGWGRK